MREAKLEVQVRKVQASFREVISPMFAENSIKLYLGLRETRFIIVSPMV